MASLETILGVASTLFFVTNPIGNSPVILALVKEFDFPMQKRILIREGLFALLIALFFQYLGSWFLHLLKVDGYAISLTGGILLIMVAFSMIFPKKQEKTESLKQEPYIVPIATPLLSGPGLLSIIMLFTQEKGNLAVSISIIIAWIGVMIVMATAPYLQKLLGQRGLIALEQLMGMILTMISMSMIVSGTVAFLKTL